MTPNAILSRVRKAQTLDDLHGVLQELSNCEPETLFSTLFPNAIQRQERGLGVAFSAYVLYELNPPCPLNLEDAIRKVINGWDVSIEEVPWYLTNQFGFEAVVACAEEIHKCESDAAARTALEAFIYWVRVPKR
jgi:hypothetical protein